MCLCLKRYIQVGIRTKLIVSVVLVIESNITLSVMGVVFVAVTGKK